MFVKAAFKPSVRTYLLPKDAEGQNEEENEDEEEGKIELWGKYKWKILWFDCKFCVFLNNSQRNTLF